MNALPEEKKTAPAKKPASKKKPVPKAPPLTPEEKMARDYAQALKMESWIQWADSYADKAALSHQAAEAFEKLGDYEDCPERKAACLAMEQEALSTEQDAAFEQVKADYEAAKTPEDYYYVGQKLGRFGHLEAAKSLRKQAAQKRKKLLHARRMSRRLIAAVVCACIIAAAALVYTGQFQYTIGNFYYHHQQYDHALSWYLRARKVSGAEERIVVCRYQRGVYFMGEEKYPSAYKKFRLVEDYEDAAELGQRCLLSSLAEAQPGKKVTLGMKGSSYLKWMVLENDGSQVTLIGEFGEGAVFDAQGRDWPESELRAYLNGEWYQSRLGRIDRSCLVPQNEDGDLVVLLSQEQAQQYDAILNATDENGKRLDSYKPKTGWWLSTPGAGEGGACFVHTKGEIDTYGRIRSEEGLDARPVLTIKLDQP